MPVSIDSNSTSGFFNEEVALKVPGAGPNWPLEPNSWSDFGGDLKTVAREPITNTRQRKKGTVTDLDVVGGYACDFTQNNVTRQIQGFLFSDARTKPTNQPIWSSVRRSLATQVAHPKGGVLYVTGLLSVTANDTFSLTGTQWATLGVKVGHIIKTRGFINAGNNFVWYVTAVNGATITVAPYDGLFIERADGTFDVQTTVMAVEASSALTVFDVVGFRLNAAATLTVSSEAQAFLSDAVTDFTTLGLIPGEFMYLGDYADAEAFIDKGFGDSGSGMTGYGRISSITAHKITFDVTVIDNVSEWLDSGGHVSSAGATNVFFGTVIKNENDPALIIRRTYSIYRSLGTDVSNQDIYELIKGSVSNQLSIDTKSNDKLTMDLTYVAMDTAQKVGTISGPDPLGEEPYNTSQDVFAMLLYIINTANSNQVPLFGYATDEKLTVNNNVKANKAIGVVGGFEASVGMMDVSGSLSCYFDDERSISAVRNNADVGLTNIFAKKNEGMILDLPLLTLGGGRLKVVKDTPIMADITHQAATGANQTTILYNKFGFLPGPAMSNYTPYFINGISNGE